MVSSVNPEFEWLISDQAAGLLEATGDAFAENTNPLKIAQHLRKTVSPTQAAMVMEQAQLRIRAARKFPLADQMFFTQRGLEQSSGYSLAQYKAQYFQTLDRVADICCGIGGDLMALATRAPDSTSPVETVGIDIDPVTAMFAQYNLQRHLNHSQITNQRAVVQETDFESMDLSQYTGLHLDPDRRQGRRTTDGRHFRPALNDILDRITDQQCVCVKVAPATSQTDYLPTAIHRQWLGDQRECKQQLLWLNSAHPPGQRSATVVDNAGQAHSIHCDGREKVDRPVAANMMKYLHEPKSSVLAAGLEDHLAIKHDLRRIAFDIPYYLSESPIDDPLLARFKVVKMTKLDSKHLQNVLAERSIGKIELKQRGIDKVTYDRVRKIKTSGPCSATLILTRYGPKHKRCAIIAKRLP